MHAPFTQRIVAIRTLADYYLKNDISSEEDRKMAESGLATLRIVESRLPAFLNASRAHQDDVTLGMLENDSGIGGAIKALQAACLECMRISVEEQISSLQRGEVIRPRELKSFSSEMHRPSWRL